VRVADAGLARSARLTKVGSSKTSSKIKHCARALGSRSRVLAPRTCSWTERHRAPSMRGARHERFGGRDPGLLALAFSDGRRAQARHLCVKDHSHSISSSSRSMTSRCRSPARQSGVSHSHYDLADPARKGSRLGVADKAAIERVADRISGLMFHVNCENASLPDLSCILGHIGREYGPLLRKMQWSRSGRDRLHRRGLPARRFLRPSQCLSRGSTACRCTWNRGMPR